MRLGIYSVSSQSGRAFFADMMNKGHEVYGYARESEHGREFVDAVTFSRGIFLERPRNLNKEPSIFVSLYGESKVGHDIKKLIDFSEVIYIALPSNHIFDAVEKLKEAGITEKKIPIIVAPPRSFATPYIWQILGDGYPVVSYSTCPYSCKAPSPDVALIKLRKRTWYASLEGNFTKAQESLVKSIFAKAVYNTEPFTTTLGNIGAVFHPATYLYNYEEIKKAEDEGRTFSFYIEGIANRPEVGEKLEAIDQVRLQIADRLGFKTYGLKADPREEEWAKMTEAMYSGEAAATEDITILRKIRHDCMAAIGDAICSTLHWLDYTYGVRRQVGESLSSAIGRTPNYQQLSVPQTRYVTEDIPGSLVPLAAFARRLGIDASPMDEVIELADKYFEINKQAPVYRDLQDFSDEYLISYLKGEFFQITD